METSARLENRCCGETISVEPVCVNDLRIQMLVAGIVADHAQLQFAIE